MEISATSIRNNPSARKSMSQFSEFFDEIQKTSYGKLGVAKDIHMGTKRGT